MALIDNNTFDAWGRNCQTFVRQMSSVLDDGEEAYQVWQTFRAARTNAQIAADMADGTTEAMVQKLDSAYSALHYMYEFARNGTTIADDHRFSMRQFMG